MKDCTVRGNTAEISAGIRNAGTLNLVSSTVSGNSNTGATDGAGIHIGDSASATVTNSTVSGNTGEGIRNAGALNLANSTVSGHSDGSIVNDPGASLTLKGTLIDDDCDDQGETVSLGYNIETGNTCIPNPAGSDQIDATVDLEALADNGGPTMTHALGAGSIAAIDKIPEAECGVETDQRGQPRPETGGTMCDVGAFELQP